MTEAYDKCECICTRAPGRGRVPVTAATFFGAGEGSLHHVRGVDGMDEVGGKRRLLPCFQHRQLVRVMM